MPGLSFPKDPRSGQWSVIEESKNRLLLNVKLPTGYGKTLAACYAYALKKHLGVANRLLGIFPSDGQLEQFIRDGHRDLADAGVSGPTKIVDIRHAGNRSVRDHRNNIAQVFVTTIQSLIERRGFGNVTDLLEIGQWMIWVDEYHHYGEAKSWGRTVLGLNRAFLLAMSATPTRPTEDSAFGIPHISVLYRTAEEEGVVKKLKGHAYTFRIEAINDKNETFVFTTAELIDAAGSDQPADIEKLRIERKMRWSPRYVSPMVQIPIDRMLNNRIATGYKLQVLISAMCVSHAKLVCEQVSEMYPELRCDWVGTGEHGRSSEENIRVLKEFCPPKDEDGVRHPTLDVLVHVGMAGEGLDSVHVSEIVLLCNASLCNRILQIVGRGARHLPGVMCNVSFDSSSDFAQYVGTAIMDAMDLQPPKQEDDDEPPGPPEIPEELPREPQIHIAKLDLVHIDSGTEGVRHMAKTMHQLAPNELNFEALNQDPKHSDWAKVIETYRQMRRIESEAHDERSVIEQWRDKIGWALTSLTGLIVFYMNRDGVVIEDKMKMRGEIKKKLNRHKKRFCGSIENDLDILKRHYGWCVELDRQLRDRKTLPSWLLP